MFDKEIAGETKNGCTFFFFISWVGSSLWSVSSQCARPPIKVNALSEFGSNEADWTLVLSCALYCVLVYRNLKLLEDHHLKENSNNLILNDVLTHFSKRPLFRVYCLAISNLHKGVIFVMGHSAFFNNSETESETNILGLKISSSSQ